MMFFKNFISNMSISDIIIYFFMFVLVIFSFKNKKNTIMYANFITALGMIGTFLGICIGLSDFDPNEITKSIPMLLQGMRTAFFTSLIGMSISIILKFKYGNFKEKVEIDTTEGAIIEQTKRIIELNDNIKDMTKILKDMNDSIYKNSLREKEHEKDLIGFAENLKHLEFVKEALKDIDSHIDDINGSIGDNIKKQSELSTKTNELLLDLFNSSENIKDEVSENKKFSEQIVESSRKNTETIVTKITENSIQNAEKIIKSNTEVLKAVETCSEKAQESSSELIAEFRDFAKTMAENNNKAFIQALNESMKDLNTKLTEQFGENFKELNKAVFKLVEWQDHYKNTVIETTENQKVIFNGISKAKDDLEKFVIQGERVSKIADDLNNTITFANKEHDEFNSEIKILSDINKSAKELIPNLIEINSRIFEDVNAFKDSLSEINTGINKTSKVILDDMQKIYEDMYININSFNEEFRDTLKNNSEQIKNNNNAMIKEMGDSGLEYINKLNELTDKFIEDSTKKTGIYMENINSLFDKTIEQIRQVNINLEAEGREITTKTSSSIEQMNNNINEALKINVENINKGLEAALNTALSSLGNELAILSNKFVKDYSPLTDNLREIVSMSKGVRR